MSDLTILVPSKGRPKSAVQLYESFRDTTTASTELVIVCDESDLYLPTYFSLLTGVGRVVVVPGGRRGMCDALNQAYQGMAESLGLAVGFMGDDHRPRTRGWDSNYLEALANLGSGFVYGNDLFQYEAIPTQVAMTSDIPEKLGYMVPLGFQHLCVDVVWKDWGMAINKLTYLPDTVIEHMHPLAGKGKSDSNYQAVNNHVVAESDIAEYKRYNESGEFGRDVARISELLFVR